MTSLTASTSALQGERLAELEALLADNVSATLALEEWCARHAIGDPPEILALPVTGDGVAIPDDAQAVLKLEPGETIRVRHVRLVCGNTVLSFARNFYVPERLPAATNRALETTSLPFGRVVASLGYTRERLDTARGKACGCPADTVLSHRAMLRLPDGRPLSLLAECYTRDAIAAAS